MHKGDLQLILVHIVGTTIWQLSKVNEKGILKPKRNKSFWLKEASRVMKRNPPLRTNINESKLESKRAESIYDVALNDFPNGLLRNNGVKDRLYFDATVLGKRYHSVDQYGAHRSKDGATISLVDKSLAEVNDRLFQT